MLDAWATPPAVTIIVECKAQGLFLEISDARTRTRCPAKWELGLRIAGVLVEAMLPNTQGGQCWNGARTSTED